MKGGYTGPKSTAFTPNIQLPSPRNDRNGHEIFSLNNKYPVEKATQLLFLLALPHLDSIIDMEHYYTPVNIVETQTNCQNTGIHNIVVCDVFFSVL